jgi:hypothetical protein
VKISAFIIVSAVLLGGCAAMPERSNLVNQQLPLRCAECLFVESTGSRVVSGKIYNDSEKPIESITLIVNFKDSGGNAVGENESIVLPGQVLKPQEFQNFSVRMSNNTPSITQAVAHFEASGGHQTLSPPVVLFLIVSLDNNRQEEMARP